MAFGFRLVGHVEDVEDCFFADFQPALHDPFGDLGVANRTGHYRFRGVVALLLRQDVVVRFDTKDDLFFFCFLPCCSVLELDNGQMKKKNGGKDRTNTEKLWTNTEIMLCLHVLSCICGVSCRTLRRSCG